MISYFVPKLKTPDGRILLSQLSIQIDIGTKLALTGPNGCGKSTLLRYLAGIESKSLVELPVFPISFLPTKPLEILLPWATLAYNIKLFSRLANRDYSLIKDEFAQFAEAIKLTKSLIWDQEVYKLSSGQQALAAIFCSLIQKPRLLIADEIFSTLASSTKEKIAALLKQKNDLTMIFATHEIQFVELLDAKTICLERFMKENFNHV